MVLIRELQVFNKFIKTECFCKDILHKSFNIDMLNNNINHYYESY